MSLPEHRAAAAQTPVRCAILTISDTRTPATDLGGPKARELLESFGHVVHDAAIVRDEPAEIRDAVGRWLAQPEIEAIVTTGGTGISRRDSTVEVIRDLLAIELDGFGELFRMLSWDQVGPAAMLSRAVGGIAARPQTSFDNDPGVFVFALPGSVKAVELAVSQLIGPELAHLVGEIRKSGNVSR